MGIGQRLKQAIQSRNITLKEFSVISNIPYRTLQKYIADTITPGTDALTKIHVQLGTSTDWLLTGEEPMYPEPPTPEEPPPPSIDNLMKKLTKHQQRTLLGIAQEMLLVRKMAEKLGEKLDEEI